MMYSIWGHWKRVACAMPYDPTVDLAAKNFDDPYQNFEKESYCRHVDLDEKNLDDPCLNAEKDNHCHHLHHGKSVDFVAIGSHCDWLTSRDSGRGRIENLHEVLAEIHVGCDARENN